MMYIARDTSGTLWLYENKPIKLSMVWHHYEGRIYFIDSDLFPEVKWEDEEPTEIEIVIKKK